MQNYSKPVDEKSGSETVLVGGLVNAIFRTFATWMFLKKKLNRAIWVSSYKEKCDTSKRFSSILLCPSQYDFKEGKKEDFVYISFKVFLPFLSFIYLCKCSTFSPPRKFWI